MRTILTLGAALVVASSAIGCSSDTDPGRRSVVASFYPLAFAAERLAGDCMEVRDLTPAGTEPHDLELDPDGAEAIATADLVVYLGGGFQPAVEEAIPDAEGSTVDLLDAVDPLPPPTEESEEDLAVDPHVWLDPRRFTAIVDRIAEVLATKGVPASCDVGARAEQLRSELASLDAAFADGLATCELDLLVTSHAAFGYLADAYGLRQEAIAGVEPETEPDPQRLAELSSLVEQEGVTTVFTEDLVSPEVAEVLAREAGVRTAVLHTIEGLTDEQRDRGEDYVTLMEENLDALRAALRCS
jgi:zinc transport system substrate-binding protein